MQRCFLHSRMGIPMRSHSLGHTTHGSGDNHTCKLGTPVGPKVPHFPALSQTRRALQRHSSWLKRLDCLKGSQTYEHTRVKNVCEAKGTLWRRGGIQGSLLRKRIPRSHQKEEIYRAVRKLPLVTWRRGGELSSKPAAPAVPVQSSDTERFPSWLILS